MIGDKRNFKTFSTSILANSNKKSVQQCLEKLVS